MENKTTYVAATPVGAAFPGARWSALRPAPAQPLTMALAPVNGVLSAVNRTLKQNNVHKTRIGAGEYGATGPHPEREPA